MSGRPLGGRPLAAHTYGFASGSAVGISPQAQQFLNRLATPPTAARKALIATYINALVAADIWDDLDVLYLLAAADAATAVVNLKAASFAAVAVDSPTFEADRGYTGNDSSSYLRTQYTPSTAGGAFALNNASLWVWSRTSGQHDHNDAGNAGTHRTSMIIRNTSDQMFGRCNETADANTRTVTSGSGLFGTSRASSSAKKLWQNGVQLGADIATNSTSLTTEELWVCAANPGQFSIRQIAAFAVGSALTGKEAAFYAATLAYMQGVGAA